MLPQVVSDGNVDRAQHIVEQQDRRLAIHRTRDRDTLFLSTTQVQPSFADLGRRRAVLDIITAPRPALFRTANLSMDDSLLSEVSVVMAARASWADHGQVARRHLVEVRQQSARTHLSQGVHTRHSWSFLVDTP